MLSISNYERNASQKNNEILPHTSQQTSSKYLQTINTGEGVQKREPSYTVGGNINRYSQYREQYGGSLKK